MSYLVFSIMYLLIINKERFVMCWQSILLYLQDVKCNYGWLFITRLQWASESNFLQSESCSISTTLGYMFLYSYDESIRSFQQVETPCIPVQFYLTKHRCCISRSMWTASLIWDHSLFRWYIFGYKWWLKHLTLYKRMNLTSSLLYFLS